MRRTLFLKRIFFLLIFVCFAYAVFVSGVSFTLFYLEKMISQQNRELHSAVVISSDRLMFGYGELLLRFCFISLGLFATLLTTFLLEKKLYNIRCIILNLACIFPVVFFSSPGYVPGLNSEYSSDFLKILTTGDIFFVIILAFSSILSLIIAFQNRKINSP